MRPFIMQPVFRHGMDTPWGGSKLKELFNKDIPDDKTGESLEVSVLPGLTSIAASGEHAGQPLDVLIEKYGDAICGTSISRPFPLLLKIIGADTTLSVQVHPDDAYARADAGKLGKTEAWVVLAAPPRAKLVYGIRPEVTREALEITARSGKQIEQCLRWMSVRKGDVLYIPAGMVHALGDGVVVYEIQQSSDVTYRFWDWERTDDKGNPRQLHIEKALDVTRINLQYGKLNGIKLPVDGNGWRTLLIADKNFALERLCCDEEIHMRTDGTRFYFLTALGDCTLQSEDQTLSLNAGTTVFLPATTGEWALHGAAEALLAYVPHRATILSQFEAMGIADMAHEVAGLTE